MMVIVMMRFFVMMFFAAVFGFGFLLVIADLTDCGAGFHAFEFFFSVAAGFFFLLGEQRHAVGDGDLIIIGVDFREGQKALPVAAILYERSLKRRLHARDFRELDFSFERPLGGGLEIKFLDLLAVQYDNPGLFRVA
jgi:hypothetical protein